MGTWRYCVPYWSSQRGGFHYPDCPRWHGCRTLSSDLITSPNGALPLTNLEARQVSASTPGCHPVWQTVRSLPQRKTHSLAALLLYVAATELGLVQAISTDATVLRHLAARALSTPPRPPPLLHRRLLRRLVSGDRLNRFDGWSKGFSIFWASSAATMAALSKPHFVFQTCTSLLHFTTCGEWLIGWWEHLFPGLLCCFPLCFIYFIFLRQVFAGQHLTLNLVQRLVFVLWEGDRMLLSVKMNNTWKRPWSCPWFYQWLQGTNLEAGAEIWTRKESAFQRRYGFIILAHCLNLSLETRYSIHVDISHNPFDSSPWGCLIWLI